MTGLPEPLPSPLIVPGRITTLMGPLDDELAALTAALAVSYKTGHPLIPGFVPEGPGEVSVAAYRYRWIDWKCLVTDICVANDLAAPALHVACPDRPLLREFALPRDPDAQRYWDPIVIPEIERAIKTAMAEARQHIPHLTIVFGVEAAAGGPDGFRQLYEEHRGQTALMVGVEEGSSWAAEYGSLVALPDMHNEVSWRDVLARVTGVDPPAHHAKERMVLDGPFAAPERPQIVRTRSADSVGTMFGYASVFAEWREENSPLMGRYLERVASGAFANGIQRHRGGMKVCFRHGKSPEWGFQSLGPITIIEEDRHGLFYEVELANAARALVPGLEAGTYGSSVTYKVVADELVKDPGPSAHNPDGVPELTILEALCSEFGPCEHPAFPGTSAGIRLAL